MATQQQSSIESWPIRSQDHSLPVLVCGEAEDPSWDGEGVVRVVATVSQPCLTLTSGLLQSTGETESQQAWEPFGFGYGFLEVATLKVCGQDLNSQPKTFILGTGKVKSAYCSCRRPRFVSQNTHGGSQQYVALVLGYLTQFSGIGWHQACMQYTHIYVK